MSEARDSQSVTVVHPIFLLAEPMFGAQALTFLESGVRLHLLAAKEGFLHVQRDARVSGYLPSAVCAPHAVEAPQGVHPITYVFQPVTLYQRPLAGSQHGVNWIVPPDEQLLVIGREFQFVHVQRQNGQVGYVPQILCRPIVPSHSSLPTTQLRQAVALYSMPEPGAQLSSQRIVSPKEPLLVLGRDNGFVLIQRDDGQLGYVPAALCGEAAPELILKAGPVDLGWIALGIGWALFNWPGVALLLRQSAIVDPALAPYLGLAVLLGVAALLWFGSRRRQAARSFAIGLLLAYALMHYDSRGAYTLWP